MISEMVETRDRIQNEFYEEFENMSQKFTGRPYDDQLPQARSRSEGKGEDSYAGRRGCMC